MRAMAAGSSRGTCRAQFHTPRSSARRFAFTVNHDGGLESVTWVGRRMFPARVLGSRFVHVRGHRIPDARHAKAQPRGNNFALSTWPSVRTLFCVLSIPNTYSFRLCKRDKRGVLRHIWSMRATVTPSTFPTGVHFLCRVTFLWCW